MLRFRLPARRLPALALLVVVLGGCAGGDPAAGPAVTSEVTSDVTAPPSATQPGAPTSAAAEVPEQLRFTAKTLDGQDFDGASLAGKPAVLWFWAPWCPNCRAEAGDVAKIAQEHADRVRFVGVAAQDQVPAMQQFVDQYGVDFAHLADTDAAVWRRFGVTYQPAYAFIDSSGRVEVVKQQLGGEELASRVAALT